MKVVRIDWSHEPSKLADVEISDGIHSILVMCHPCEYKIGQVTQDYLRPLFVDNLHISDCKTPKIVKVQGSYYGYKIYAEVLNYYESIVCVGDIKFIINEGIDFGVNKGEVVEFETLRVDLW